MRARLFFCALLLSMLALAPPLPAMSSPMVTQVGSAVATLSLSPDPPQPGPEHATVSVTGVSPDVLARTTVRFASEMPAMGMRGQTGTARAVAGRVGQWDFDLPMGMPTQWLISL